MKKIILTVVAAMTMTFGFAETEENQAVRADGSRRGYQQQPEH